MKRCRSGERWLVALAGLGLAACSSPRSGGAPSSAPVAPPASSEVSASAASTGLGGPLRVFPDAPASARFLSLPARVEPPICSRVFVAAAKGTLTVGDHSLSEGDVLVLLHPVPIAVRGSGKAVYVEVPLGGRPMRGESPT